MLLSSTLPTSSVAAFPASMKCCGNGLEGACASIGNALARQSEKSTGISPYPHLSDDSFVSANLSRWLQG